MCARDDACGGFGLSPRAGLYRDARHFCGRLWGCGAAVCGWFWVAGVALGSSLAHDIEITYDHNISSVQRGHMFTSQHMCTQPWRTMRTESHRICSDATVWVNQLANQNSKHKRHNYDRILRPKRWPNCEQSSEKTVRTEKNGQTASAARHPGALPRRFERRALK